MAKDCLGQQQAEDRTLRLRSVHPELVTLLLLGLAIKPEAMGPAFVRAPVSFKS